MSFAIRIYAGKIETIEEEGGTTARRVRLTKEVAETHLSCHWHCMAYLCPLHLLTTCHALKCPMRPLWSFDKECHGRRGDRVAESLRFALEKLHRMGIVPYVPPYNDPHQSWRDGLTPEYETPLPPRQRLHAFAQVLKELRDLALTHSECFFLGDHRYEEGERVLYIDGDDKTPVPYELPPPPVVYFHSHPTKGCVRVDSFYTAIEIYGLLLVKNDPNAHKWLAVARRMPDVPPNTI